MGVRERLVQNKPLGIGLAVVFIVGAVVLGVINTRDVRPPGFRAAFYSADDGKTFFVDSISKSTPFQVDGKDAYKVQVFACKDGKQQFVGYIERMNPEVKAELDKYKAANSMPDTPTAQRLFEGGAEVKYPGETKWRKLSEFGPSGPPVKCPDNNPETPRPVVAE